ncbi:TM2 domain-containing protein 3 isoform 4-T4 [Alca torda]
MAALAGLRALRRLCGVALFLSQLYILSGRGERGRRRYARPSPRPRRGGSLMTTKHSQPQSTFGKSLTSTSTNTPYFKIAESTEIPSYVTKCPSNGLCSRLPPDCMTCNTNYSCIYGKPATFDCKVKPYVHCLGNRVFPKMLYCNWTGGYKWSTALALSITLGGFGADRFYLGQWREGLGKLFSFGGLGIWTLIDVLLIGVGYVGPADGSLYI